MKPPVDMFGKEIKVGNILVYPVCNSSSVSMKMGVVSEIRIETGSRWNYEKSVNERNVEYPVVFVDKYIDMTRTFWKGDGHMNNENIPEDAVHDHDYTDRQDNNTLYQIFKLEKFVYKKYRLESTHQKMVVDTEMALKWKGSNKPEPYVEKAKSL